jgi:Ca2+:H+ antiporter
VYLKRSLGEVLFGTKLNILGLCIPLAFIAEHQEWDQGYIFAFSLLAIAPIAERIGFVTEQLALYTNPTIGGLLNASMGNITGKKGGGRAKLPRGKLASEGVAPAGGT